MRVVFSLLLEPHVAWWVASSSFLGNHFHSWGHTMNQKPPWGWYRITSGGHKQEIYLIPRIFWVRWGSHESDSDPPTCTLNLGHWSPTFQSNGWEGYQMEETQEEYLPDKSDNLIPSYDKCRSISGIGLISRKPLQIMRLSKNSKTIIAVVWSKK